LKSWRGPARAHRRQVRLEFAGMDGPAVRLQGESISIKKVFVAVSGLFVEIDFSWLLS
jgi:hypothetical protein